MNAYIDGRLSALFPNFSRTMGIEQAILVRREEKH
jgi:hypothetical protein